MKLRKRFLGLVGSLAVMASGAYSSEPQPTNSNPQPVAPTAAAENQQAANEIAGAIARAVSDHGYSVSVDYRGGVVTLRGTATSPNQVHRILEAALSCPSVKLVVNELRIAD